jgi:uncharacterized protein YbbC (DUF1343 family)
MKFRLGIDQLLESPDLTTKLKAKRIGLVAHPASMTSSGDHTLDALFKDRCSVVRAFGPQHGMRGDVQDNMIETQDYLDPAHQIPIVSLYGEHRYPTEEMIEDLDIILYDLQDVGCRIYTYISTLKYFIDACSDRECELWILDRPNPAGRPIDGLFLQPGEQSFVGCDELPTRHGLTVGELGLWFNSRQEKPANLRVIQMSGYEPQNGPDFGWPTATIPWVNPSPNAASVNMTRCFPGTVLLEGTTLSEGRGTTVPLEIIGAPAFPVNEILDKLNSEAPHWLDGVRLRSCFFEPTFHKHVGELCAGIQFHTDFDAYQHEVFKPYRLIAGLLKSFRLLVPDTDLWRYHEYEYELNRTPIDVINGGPTLREWVDDDQQGFSTMEAMLDESEQRWQAEREPFITYP